MEFANELSCVNSMRASAVHVSAYITLILAVVVVIVAVVTLITVVERED